MKAGVLIAPHFARALRANPPFNRLKVGQEQQSFLVQFAQAGGNFAISVLRRLLWIVEGKLETRSPFEHPDWCYRLGEDQLDDLKGEFPRANRRRLRIDKDRFEADPKFAYFVLRVGLRGVVKAGNRRHIR